MKKVFLVGSTDKNSTWRKTVIEQLKIDYACPAPNIDAEIVSAMKARCDVIVHVLTPYREFGQVSAVITDAARYPHKTVFTFLTSENGTTMDDSLKWHMECLSKGVEELKATALPHDNLDALVEYLNALAVEIPYNPNVIECLIQRDGPTYLSLGKQTYCFQDNEAGDAVCEVLNADHRRYLLKLPDFRVYQKHLQPKREFTDAEEDFIKQWRTLSAMRFQEYVNAHISRMFESRLKVRKMIVEKWRALMPHIDCPVHTYPDPLEADPDDKPRDPDPVKVEDAPVPVETAPPDPHPSENWTDEQWAAWQKQWARLNAANFTMFVFKNEDALMNSPDDIFDAAEAKWKRMLPDRPWPYEDEGDEVGDA